MRVLILFNLLVGFSHCSYHSGSRLERDGLYLSQTDETPTGPVSLQYAPPTFSDALIVALRPSSQLRSYEDVHEDLSALAQEAITGMKSGCGICSGIVAILLSLDGSLIPLTQLHSILVGLPARNLGGIGNAFYSLSKDYGSTMGILGSTKIAASYGHMLEESDCVEIANTVALLAREAASVDVFDKLVPPHTLDFKLGTRPRDRITDDMFEDDSTDVHYYVSLMKDNAQALSSALLFGMADVADMLGLEPGAVDPDDLRESVEMISTLEEKAIAQELLMTINSIRHNLQVTRFNEGLELHSTADKCGEGLLIHHSIVGQQSLFAKIMFFYMKVNFFDMGNKFNSLLNALIMAELGIESGMRNVLSLLEENPEMIHDSDLRADLGMLMVMIPTNGLDCAVGTHISRSSNLDEAACLDTCIHHPNCANVLIRDGSCELYSTCNRSAITKTYRTYVKDSFPSTHPCWPPTSNCIVRIHQDLAETHMDLDSMNWLARHFASNSEFSTASEWAERSGMLGDPEGTFFSGYLQLKEWDGHPVDADVAEVYFRDLISRSAWDNISELFSTDHDDDQADNLERMEIESARGIAIQFGLHDIEPIRVDNLQHAGFVQFAAGIYGIALVYSHQYSYILPRLVTVVALVPVLAILIARRTYLD